MRVKQDAYQRGLRALDMISDAPELLELVVDVLERTLRGLYDPDRLADALVARDPLAESKGWEYCRYLCTFASGDRRREWLRFAVDSAALRPASLQRALLPYPEAT